MSRLVPSRCAVGHSSLRRPLPVAALLALAGAAHADPATLVQFSWSTTGATDASASASCNIPDPPKGCTVTQSCSSDPEGGGFSTGGTTIAFLQTTIIATNGCTAVCNCCIGGAGGNAETRSSPRINDPVSNSDTTRWTLGGEIGVAASAGAPPPGHCAVGAASGSATSEHEWTLVFDVAADATHLDLATEHGLQVIGPGMSATSTIRLRGPDGPTEVYAQTLTRSEQGGSVGSESVSLILAPGRYTFTIESSAIGANAASSDGVGGSTLIDAVGDLMFTEYTCVGTTPAPDDMAVCPGQNATFQLSPVGSGPFAFQWRKDGVPLVDGDDYFGVQAPNLTVINASESDEGEYDCVVTDLCGAVPSGGATLTVSIEGDYDNDGDVDFADLNIVLSGYNVIYFFADLNELLSNYNTDC